MRVLRVIKSSTFRDTLELLGLLLNSEVVEVGGGEEANSHSDSTRPRREYTTDDSNDERAVSKVECTIRVDLQQQTAPPTTLDPLGGPTKSTSPT